MVAAYRLAIRLYPRTFRDEYGDDLVLLLTDQLRNDRAPRVAVRTAVDLLLTVPQRHLESRMSTTRPSTLPTVLGAVALSVLVVAIVVGHPTVLAGDAAAFLAFGGLALLAAHRDRPFTDPRPWSSRWWHLLATGVVLLAGLVVVTNATGELPSGGWLVAMTLGLGALLLVAGGVVLGIVHLASRERRSATAG